MDSEQGQIYRLYTHWPPSWGYFMEQEKLPEAITLPEVS